MKEKRRVKIFEFNVDNVIDLITNSSSELFVLEGETKQEVIDMIESIYPNYLNEYDEVKCITECSDDELDTYLSNVYGSYRAHPLDICKNFGLDPMVLYSNLSDMEIGENWYPYCSKKGIELIKSKLNPKTYLLFSLSDNPDWDKQEELMGIASRYHLG